MRTSVKEKSETPTRGRTSRHRSGRRESRREERFSLRSLSQELNNQAVQRLVKNGLSPNLEVSSPSDRYEHEAERVADQVMRTPESRVQRVCDCGGGPPSRQTQETIERRDRVQTENVGSGEPTQTSTPPRVHEALAARGDPLDPGTRRFMESRIGYDFSGVRVHTDARADSATTAIGARAFTVGADVVFRGGEFAPHTRSGRALLAHELAHVVQQRAATRIDGASDEAAGHRSPGNRLAERERAGPVQRAGDLLRHVTLEEQIQRATPASEKTADLLCNNYVYVIEKILIEGLIDDLKASPDVEKRLELIRELKWVVRCGTESEQSEIKDILRTKLGRDTAAALWKDASTPFGGYRGVYPGYYGGSKGRLKRLGVSEVEAYDPFAYDPQRGMSRGSNRRERLPPQQRHRC